MKVGLIGIGNMGAGIARSLLRGGHHVTVYNRTRSRAEALRSEGAVVTDSVEEACQSETVLTMLSDDAVLESQVFGDAGILASLPRGGVHVSLSTISVALSDRLAETHDRAGQKYVSAPVFGRPDAAEAGRLAIVAAGPEGAIEHCKPLFAAMGAKLWIVGEKQSLANVVKLTGNFLLMTAAESLSEAVALARKSGLDATALMEFLTTSLFNAPVYKVYGALMLQENHDKVSFALPLGLKDIRLALQAAESFSVPLPIASVLRDRLITAIARGYGKKDFSAIANVALEDAGLAPPAGSTTQP